VLLNDSASTSIDRACSAAAVESSENKMVWASIAESGEQRMRGERDGGVSASPDGEIPEQVTCDSLSSAT